VATANQTAPVVVYNYNQPLATAEAAPVAETEAASSESTFQAARDAFKANNFENALALADQALKTLPGDTALHEFRALALYALKRYDEASGVLYAVLTAGPGWSWSTMIGLYGDANTYTSQLRDLEAFVQANPSSPDGHFVLAYHYLTQGHPDAAAAQFKEVVALEPKDKLSASFVQALTSVKPGAEQAQPNAAANANAAAAEPPPATDASDQPQPTAPPAELVGTWTAKPDDTLKITLTIADEGDFTWKVEPKSGRPQSITGKALFLNDELALTQEQGSPLVGKVESADASTFKFTLVGGDKSPALVFKK
jgi:tetratricopeptide (TPR) repeat protein